MDRAATIASRAVASFPLDLLANADTLVGQATVASGLTFGVAVLLWRREPGGAWLAAGLLAVTVAGEVLLKFTLDHPPPPLAFDRSLWDPLGVHLGSPSSFPSGHVARITFLALLLGGVAGGSVRAGAAVIVLVTLWARVYIGDHWLSDAVGGLALGAAAGFAALAWIGRCRGRDVGDPDGPRTLMP